MDKQEIEVKFLIQDVKRIVSSLIQLGAELISPRVHEMNLRFDTPEHSLTNEQRVLRLRKDTRSHLTYKGAALTEQGVSKRQEIEFEVSDFSATQNMLEALGYEVSVTYEKYRTTYCFHQLEIVLDEMPFGLFVEIEGPDAESIKEASDSLGLNWSAGCTLSYMALFEHFKSTRKMTMENLTFSAFDNIQVEAHDLGLKYADQ